MKKIMSCITTILLGVILLTGCAAKPDYSDPSKVTTNTFEKNYVLKVDKSYDATNVVVKIDSITLMKNDSDKKYNVIIIKGKYNVLADNVYWSLENSEIKVNSKEVTIPMLTTSRKNPLNKIENADFELIAYITEVKLEDIKTLDWTIQKPAFKDGNNFTGCGPILNIPLTIVRANN